MRLIAPRTLNELITDLCYSIWWKKSMHCLINWGKPFKIKYDRQGRPICYQRATFDYTLTQSANARSAFPHFMFLSDILIELVQEPFFSVSLPRPHDGVWHGACHTRVRTLKIDSALRILHHHYQPHTHTTRCSFVAAVDSYAACEMTMRLMRVWRTSPNITTLTHAVCFQINSRAGINLWANVWSFTPRVCVGRHHLGEARQCARHGVCLTVLLFGRNGKWEALASMNIISGLQVVMNFLVLKIVPKCIISA